ncbi:VOC family protein [Paenibacillus mendelii]|uniref:VOC family protein n=1 Tax=Paenibacillus mendelii TaxID=206163 RepID=A0ABV6JFK1_9BACL|nr:VOC family protein [Paenibacillus mendelii]MCQ6557362.1 VOC family protein [Paenibacillus mendelii]
MSESIQSVTTQTIFNNIGSLYLPVDNGNEICQWYEKYFNSASARNLSLFWETTQEKGLTCNFWTDEWIPGETYEMFAVRFETDAIEELYERLSAAHVKLEPLHDVDKSGLMFVYTDPQGNKFQVWQRSDTQTQPLREGVPALIGVAALFFPVKDRAVTYSWYTDFLGIERSVSGQPMTSLGQEFHFYRSIEPGRTLNFYTGAGEIQHMAIAMVQMNGVEAFHRRMIDSRQRVQEEILDREGCGYQFQLYDPDGNKLDIWDLQTMVVHIPDQSNSPDWKDRFAFFNCCFHVGMDEFVQKMIEGAPGSRHKRLQILDTAFIRESDPEGLNELVAALEQFGKQYPQWAVDIDFREGPSIF